MSAWFTYDEDTEYERRRDAHELDAWGCSRDDDTNDNDTNEGAEALTLFVWRTRDGWSAANEHGKTVVNDYPGSRDTAAGNLASLARRARVLADAKKGIER